MAVFSRKETITATVVALAVLFIAVPQKTNAEFMDGNTECGTKYCYPGKCVPSPKDPKCVPCPTFTCTDVTNTRTSKGKCVNSAPGLCRGTSSQGPKGEQSPLGGQVPKEIMDILKGLLDKIMQQKGGGEGQQGQQQPQQQPGQQPCLTTYTVTTPTSDSCAIFNPGAGNLITTSGTSSGTGQNVVDELYKAITGDENEPASTNGSEEDDAESGDEETDTAEDIRRAIKNIDNKETGVLDEEDVEDAEEPAVAQQPVLGAGNLGLPVSLGSGLAGRIEEWEAGATAVARERDEKEGFEVSGFYGEAGSSSAGNGIVARLCTSRPWAGSVVSYVIPSSFFDSLCEWRGYAYEPPRSVGVVRTVVRTAEKPTTSAVPTRTDTPVAAPRVRVWAVPDHVPVGSRTSIFWNSRGVDACTVTSPDGSFNETGTSGGASTVPLSGPTTFSISCTSADNEPVVGHVTVEIAL